MTKRVTQFSLAGKWTLSRLVGRDRFRTQLPALGTSLWGERSTLLGPPRAHLAHVKMAQHHVARLVPEHKQRKVENVAHA